MTNKDLKVINDVNLDNAVTRIKTDAVLRQDFYNQPVAVLKSMGVATEALHINRADYANKRIDTISGPATVGAFQLCVSVGEIIGASLGWDL